MESRIACLAVAPVHVATRTALAESGNLFDSQNRTWGTFGKILCRMTLGLYRKPLRRDGVVEDVEVERFG